MKIENLMKKILMTTTSQPITATSIADGNYRIKHVHDAMEILHIFGFGTINSVLRNNNRTVRTFTKITKTIYLNSNPRSEFLTYIGVDRNLFIQTYIDIRTKVQKVSIEFKVQIGVNLSNRYK